ncbi:MAG: hypothetical protein JWN82_274 [Candidatus Saccharibacteria bacterium]|nr:hypothetical protein [Candidatus Saccharibacteria bacterium]
MICETALFYAPSQRNLGHLALKTVNEKLIKISIGGIDIKAIA